MSNKKLFVWLTIGYLIFTIFNPFGGQKRTDPIEIEYSSFLVFVKAKEIQSVRIDEQGKMAYGLFNDGKQYRVVVPTDPELLPLLVESGARISANPPYEPGFLSVLLSWVPMLLLIGVWFYFIKKASGSGGGAGIFGIGKSKARLLERKEARVTFEDVAGIDEAKQELQEVIDFLKDPRRFQALGGKIPKGVLLLGPPGTGKTLLARAIAGEANVPFFSVSGSDFVEMFVGVGASRVRDMFEQARKNAPCIIFIDEVDGVGRLRGSGRFIGGGHDEKEQTLNQLLTEMDGFETKEGVIVIAATNRPDVLDPALVRPGRFDRQIVISNPDIVGREQILKIHTNGMPIAADVQLRTIARGTPGFSGAELANLVNEAALLAARKGEKTVSMSAFESAKDKMLMGIERRSMVMTETQKKLAAYHEAGHALVGLMVPEHDPLHKVTIIPRGRALGLTVSLPEHDRLNFSQSELTSLLAVLFGGRIAEELKFGKEHITTGASNDIKQATSWAFRMVVEFGFSEKLGPVNYQHGDEAFSEWRMVESKTMSEATALMIDEEVRRLIDEAKKTAHDILSRNFSVLQSIAEALLERETLTGEEVRKIVEETSSASAENGAVNAPS